MHATKLNYIAILFICLQLPSLVYSQQYTYDFAGRISQVRYQNNTAINYTYDKDGNRLSSVVTAFNICSGRNASFFSGTLELTNTYQWQVNTGSGFTNINNDAIYSGSTFSILVLNSPPTVWYGYKYRCVINGASGQNFSAEEELKFSTEWIGTVSSSWENPANWSCNSVPDKNTDVIISNRFTYSPIVNSEAEVRTLSLFNNASLNVNSGYKLSVFH